MTTGGVSNQLRAFCEVAQRGECRGSRSTVSVSSPPEQRRRCLDVTRPAEAGTRLPPPERLSACCERTAQVDPTSPVIGGSRRSASGRLGHLLEHQASGQFAPIPAIHGPRWNRELRPQSVRRLTADRLGSRRNPHTRSQIRCGPQTWRKRATSSLAWHAEHHAALTGPAAARPSCDADDFLNVLNDAADQELSCYPTTTSVPKRRGFIRKGAFGQRANPGRLACRFVPGRCCRHRAGTRSLIEGPSRPATERARGAALPCARG